eukprot:m.1264811 g.1264811  ORF g.1264811 m.1264811 type:complete len:420 (-) comp24736_c0_seq16:1184-2443(-)
MRSRLMDNKRVLRAPWATRAVIVVSGYMHVLVSTRQSFSPPGENGHVRRTPIAHGCCAFYVRVQHHMHTASSSDGRVRVHVVEVCQQLLGVDRHLVGTGCGVVPAGVVERGGDLGDGGDAGTQARVRGALGQQQQQPVECLDEVGVAPRVQQLHPQPRKRRRLERRHEQRHLGPRLQRHLEVGDAEEEVARVLVLLSKEAQRHRRHRRRAPRLVHGAEEGNVGRSVHVAEAVADGLELICTHDDVAQMVHRCATRAAVLQHKQPLGQRATHRCGAEEATQCTQDKSAARDQPPLPVVHCQHGNHKVGKRTVCERLLLCRGRRQGPRRDLRNTLERKSGHAIRRLKHRLQQDWCDLLCVVVQLVGQCAMQHEDPAEGCQPRGDALDRELLCERHHRSAKVQRLRIGSWGVVARGRGLGDN